MSYPLFADSPYRVAETERKERWWYSDGVWLDQGPTGAVVGFTWTHWLADRGVQIRDGELSEDYARQLYREARRVMGEAEEEDGGATVRAGANALHARQLLEECYLCPDVDSVVGALLERGPLVAGLSWYESLGKTVDSGGWTLCRLERDDPILGGHCVLLNGIDLDLTIDGVTGFVRLKNSWGTNWGDGGHVMISIEDLKTVMGESFLPIPPASALSPGLRQDVATEGAPYGPRETLFERSAFDSDLWTRRDTVGAMAYAEAIARGIQHLETKPPLTIGIKGAWGAGKTSLMRMIRDRLEWPGLEGTSDELRPIHLTPETAERIAAPKNTHLPWGSKNQSDVTNREVLKQAKTARATDGVTQSTRSSSDPPRLEAELKAPSDEAPPRDKSRWRPTVWFNPWMYQTGEQIWAGLAHEIIEQITHRMNRWEKERFWLHLNLKRIDEQAVRRKLYGLVLGRVVPYVIFGLTLLLAGIVLLAAGGLEQLGTILTAGGPAAVLLGAGVSTWQVLSSRVSTDLSGLVQPAAGTGRFASEQLASSHQDAMENPDYRAKCGALYLANSDIRRVLDLVATPKRPLVVFIDDLDRCSPGSVVQVIEAVNLFVAGAYPNTIFVIAMEPEMVAAHVEAVYGDLVKKLDQTSGAAGQAFDLGWRFLEKIVQLPLAVPAMEQDRTTALFESLFPREIAPVQPEDSAPAAGGDGEATGSAIGEASLSEAIAIAGNVRPEAAVKDAVRRVVERRLTIDDPEVRKAMDYAKDFLHHNPREIKRFVNLFRFYTMIYTERRLENLPSPKSLSEVSKLAVLGIRWPGLLSALALPTGGDEEQTVFELLEDPLDPSDSNESKDEALKKTLEAVGFSSATITRLLMPDLGKFLRSEPKVGAGVRGYL